jgi:DNA-directed RNA polymerase subunit RPC12/RpoP
MDVVFNCSSCEQELAVDEAASGEPIQCPSCSTTVIVPPRDQNRLEEAKPMVAVPAMTSTGPVVPSASPSPPPPAPEPAHRQLSVPQHQGPSEKLLKKAEAVVVVDTGPKVKHLRTKCIKRGMCVEVGHDRFDEVVADFIQKVGDDNVVSINPLSYGAMDTTGHMLPDYGVMIVYRG